MQETQVRSLVWEDLLEKEMAAHSSILAWKIPWTVEPSRVAKSWTRLSDFSNFINSIRHLWMRNHRRLFYEITVYFYQECQIDIHGRDCPHKIKLMMLSN